MTQHKQKRDIRWLLSLLPIIIFIASLAFSWFTAYHYSANILDSDASSEMILAKMLSENNSILSTDWIYSNELRVIHTNLVFAPLFKIFTDWHTVRFVGILIMQSIYLLSYYFLCRQLKVSRRSFFLTAAILILPYSIAYGRIVLYHNHYLMTITMGFLLSGLYLSILDRWKNKDKRLSLGIRITLLLTISLLSGLNGVRSLVVTIAPMFLTSFIILLQDESNLDSSQGIAFLEKWKGVILTLGMCVFSVIGYLINSKVFQQIYSFRSYDDATLGFNNAENSSQAVLGLLSQFGYQASRPLFSIGGIVALAGLMAAIYIVGQGISTVFSKSRITSQNASVQFAGVLFVASVGVMIMSFCLEFGEKHYLLYLIPVAVLAIPFVAVLMDQTASSDPVPTKHSAKGVLLGVVFLSLFANGLYGNAYFLHPDKVKGTYNGLGMQDVNMVNKLSNVVDFLESENYTLGYSTFWTCNIITEMTNGKINMAAIQVDAENQRVYHYDWLTAKHFQDESFVEEQKVFALLTDVQSKTVLETTMYDYAVLVYDDGNYNIYDFDFPVAPYYAMSE
ncbi:MAG: hypothetical protein GX096_13355 [Clostridiales bacterium]|nr:hypothetical protein [Clostridiales bacterium]